MTNKFYNKVKEWQNLLFNLHGKSNLPSENQNANPEYKNIKYFPIREEVAIAINNIISKHPLTFIKN